MDEEKPNVGEYVRSSVGFVVGTLITEAIEEKKDEENHDITPEEFIQEVVGAVVGTLIAEAIEGKYDPFRLYNWCFRHIDYWEDRNERKYIERMRSHSFAYHNIVIPGVKSIRRPKKPR